MTTEPEVESISSGDDDTPVASFQRKTSAGDSSWREIPSRKRLVEVDEEPKEEVIIYCRSRKTLKKTAGGVLGLALSGAAVGAVAVVTGGAAAPLAVGAASVGVGGTATGYMVNKRVMRQDFFSKESADEAFRQITTYKIMVRNGEVCQFNGKMRWVAELIGVAFRDGALVLPEPEHKFNILRSPLTYGASKVRMAPWKSFNIKQYTTDYEDTAEQKWSALSKVNVAVLITPTGVEKSYRGGGWNDAYVNELVGWYVLDNVQLLEDDTNTKKSNKIVVEDLDNTVDLEDF